MASVGSTRMAPNPEKAVSPSTGPKMPTTNFSFCGWNRICASRLGWAKTVLMISCGVVPSSA